MQMETTYSLILQIFTAGHWRDAMRLEFSEPAKGFDGPCRFHYRQDYLVDNLEAIRLPFSKSVSARFPLEWDVAVLKKAPAFLHDIAPAGAAKRSLMSRIGHERPEGVSADLFLLGRSTPAPIGHMRVKESVQALDGTAPIGFPRREVINRDNSFLEYAYNHGRNTSIIRGPDSLRLAPIYDLAPMVMDVEGVTRTTKWPKALEVAGDINWRGVCDALAEIIDPEQSFERLRQDAEHLRALPDILVAGGLPTATLNHPSIPLGKLDMRLKQWGLK